MQSIMDQKNLIVAIVVSLAILLGFQYFYELPRMRAQQEAQQAQQAQQAPAPAGQTGQAGLPTPAVPGTAPATAPVPLDRAGLLAQSPRVRIESSRMVGSIALRGGRI